VNVLVGVDVIKRKSGCGICLKLRLDFGRELTSNFTRTKDLDPKPKQIGVKSAGVVDEVRHGAGRQHRPALDQNEVQTDLEAWQSSRSRYGVLGRRRGYHKTRRSQNAMAVRHFDRLVDFERETEVVGRDDQPFQRAAPRRSRRN
jgi:hypothetical protein